MTKNTKNGNSVNGFQDSETRNCRDGVTNKTSNSSKNYSTNSGKNSSKNTSKNSVNA